MVHKVISQLSVGKYTALELDIGLPVSGYKKFRIDGKEYEPVPVYDLPNHIAIEEKGKFEGKTVEFI